MLSRDDERHLANIERQLSRSDPGLARRLRHGAQGGAGGRHRRLLVTWGLLSLVLLVAAAAAGSTVVAAFGGIGAVTAAVAYRRHPAAGRCGNAARR